MTENGIGRMWRGRTNSEQAGAYETMFRGVVLPELRDVAGCRGAYLLRRDDVDGAEFVTLTLFDSLDAVRNFAGEQYKTAVISGEAPSSAISMRPHSTSPSSSRREIQDRRGHAMSVAAFSLPNLTAAG